MSLKWYLPDKPRIKTRQRKCFGEDTEHLDGTIEFEELSDGEYPKYFAYNYVDKDMLKQYKDGVIFSTKAFPKDEYRNIGVASDGIRFAMKDEQFKKEFTEALQSGKEVRVKRFINKHQRVFQDDTTTHLSRT